MNTLYTTIKDNNLDEVQLDVHYTLLPGCKETMNCPGYGAEVDELRCNIGDYELQLTAEQRRELCRWVLENHDDSD